MIRIAVLPKSIPWVAAAFVLFWIADIVKPWPASRVDAGFTGGLGIMSDDLIAGLMARVGAYLACDTHYHHRNAMPPRRPRRRADPRRRPR